MKVTGTLATDGNELGWIADTKIVDVLYLLLQVYRETRGCRSVLKCICRYNRNYILKVGFELRARFKEIKRRSRNA